MFGTDDELKRPLTQDAPLISAASGSQNPHSNDTKRRQHEHEHEHEREPPTQYYERNRRRSQDSLQNDYDNTIDHKDSIFDNIANDKDIDDRLHVHSPPHPHPHPHPSRSPFDLDRDDIKNLRSARVGLTSDALTGDQSALQSFPPPRQALSIIGEDEPGHLHPTGYQRINQSKPDTDFITIDWFAEKDKARRAKRLFRANNRDRNPCVGKTSDWFYNIQGWVVLFMVGAMSALSGSVIHDTAQWLGGLKFGFCKGHGFWVSRKMCCVETRVAACEAWTDWSSVILPAQMQSTFWFNYFVYVVLGTLLALLASYLCVTYSPLSLGSGIAGTKVVLGGFVIKNFLAGTTLLIKSLGLVIAVASGLSLGLQGPMSHIACCWGALFTRIFPKYKENEAMKREIYSASVAAGVTAAFGAPLGGVLFSLEAMSSYFPHKTLWRSFWAASTAAVFLKYFQPQVGNETRLVQFQVFYRDETFMWIELIPFAFLGILGGLGGALFIRINGKLHRVRKGVHWFKKNRYTEVAVIAAVTCLLAFSNLFAAEGQSFLLEHLFSHCTELQTSLPDDLTDALCNQEGKKVWELMLLLLGAALGRFVLTIVTFGTQVPSGLFMPILSVGACVGRLMGWLVSEWHLKVGDTWPFQSCSGRTDCIFPSLYAVVGAAAFLGGTTRLTVSLAVIMLELTGGMEYIVPLMVAVVASKWVGDAFGKEGIFDVLISMQRYPHINPSTELVSAAIARDMMSSRVVMLTAFQETLGSLERHMNEYTYHGFPVVESLRCRRVVGFITRRDIDQEIQSNDNANPRTPVAFTLDNCPGRFTDYIDMTRKIDTHPVIVRPSMTADRVLDMFKGLGLRYIFVCNAQGFMEGVIKKKDMLKFIRRDRRGGPTRVRTLDSSSSALGAASSGRESTSFGWQGGYSREISFDAQDFARASRLNL
ncbi:hypothetical protein AAMO2058_000153600 [Amorphochlora amoebiformis]